LTISELIEAFEAAVCAYRQLPIAYRLLPIA